MTEWRPWSEPRKTFAAEVVAVDVITTTMLADDVTERTTRTSGCKRKELIG